MDINEILNQYLKHKEQTPSSQKIKSMLEKVNSYAALSGKTLLNISRNEFIDLMNKDQLIDPQAAKNRISIYSAFLEWCSEHVDASIQNITAGAYRELDYAGAMQAKLFPSFGYLMGELQKTVKMGEGNAIYPLTVFAWCGLRPEDLLAVRSEHVDCDGLRIYAPTQNKWLPLKPDMIDILRDFSQFKSCRKDNRKTVYRTDCGIYLYKTLPLEHRPKDEEFKLYQMLQRFQDNPLPNKQPEFCYQNVAVSGKWRRLYEAECGGLDLNDSANSHMIKSILGKTSGEIGLYRLAYSAYKKAFDLK